MIALFGSLGVLALVLGFVMEVTPIMGLDGLFIGGALAAWTRSSS